MHGQERRSFCHKLAEMLVEKVLGGKTKRKVRFLPELFQKARICLAEGFGVIGEELPVNMGGRDELAVSKTFQVPYEVQGGGCIRRPVVHPRQEVGVEVGPKGKYGFPLPFSEL